MPKNKRADKDRKVPKYLLQVEETYESSTGCTNGISILLLVEGATEEVYFER